MRIDAQRAVLSLLLGALSSQASSGELSEALAASSVVELVQREGSNWIEASKGVAFATASDGAVVSAYFGEDGRRAYRQLVVDRLQRSLIDTRSTDSIIAEKAQSLTAHLQRVLKEIDASAAASDDVSKATYQVSSSDSACGGAITFTSTFGSAVGTPGGRSGTSQADLSFSGSPYSQMNAYVSTYASADGLTNYSHEARTFSGGNPVSVGEAISLSQYSIAPLTFGDCGISTSHHLSSAPTNGGSTCSFWRTIERSHTCDGVVSGSSHSEYIDYAP
jgi:hypothetical protein